MGLSRTYVRVLIEDLVHQVVQLRGYVHRTFVYPRTPIAHCGQVKKADRAEGERGVLQEAGVAHRGRGADVAGEKLPNAAWPGQQLKLSMITINSTCCPAGTKSIPVGLRTGISSPSPPRPCRLQGLN